MKTKVSRAGVALVALLATAGTAMAEGEWSGNVAMTSDYTWRGVSQSNEDPAIQGGFDVGHESGFYVGTWASSIKGGPSYGDLEFDVYAGWGGNLSDAVSVDIGVLYYIYPTEDLGLDTDYIEPYASISTSFGPAEATFGVAYAPEQDSLGGDDNLYLYTDVGFGIADSPFSISGHIGYTDGALAPPLLAGDTDDTGLDWSIGASVAQGNFEVGVAYIGVEGPSINDFTDDAIVGTISASF